jgi:hypothetical protein
MKIVLFWTAIAACIALGACGTYSANVGTPFAGGGASVTLGGSPPPPPPPVVVAPGAPVPYVAPR